MRWRGSDKVIDYIIAYIFVLNFFWKSRDRVHLVENSFHFLLFSATSTRPIICISGKVFLFQRISNGYRSKTFRQTFRNIPQRKLFLDVVETKRKKQNIKYFHLPAKVKIIAATDETTLKDPRLPTCIYYYYWSGLSDFTLRKWYEICDYVCVVVHLSTHIILTTCLNYLWW